MDATVIITCYNNDRVLTAALAALSQPSRYRIETIVADDGSSDDTHEVVLAAARTDRSIVHVWQPDDGFRAARVLNLALSIARGRVVVFIDGDTVISRRTVDAHIEMHVGADKLFVVGARDWYGPVSAEAFDASLRGDHSLDSEVLLERMASRLLRSDDVTARQNREELFRRGAFRSAHRWKAFYTGHASATNLPELRFDDGFVGWGGHDWELAYRLTTRHAWQIRYETSLRVMHIDLEHSFCNPMRTGDSAAIEAFLGNVCYFVEKWPNLRSSGVFDVFLRFRYDTQRSAWELRDNHKQNLPAVNDLVLEFLARSPRRDFSQLPALLRGSS